LRKRPGAIALSVTMTTGDSARCLMALQLAHVPLSSRIKPLLEMRLEALEHLFFYVFDVGEPVPTSDIAVFTVTLKLQNEFFH
jgi:hypothetical protein